MTGTTTTATDLAVRNGHAAVAQQAALAIQPGQVTWDKFQDAALNQLGLKDAGNADKAVFLHQCQRTGLDPFSRQIYMIPRPDKQRDGSWSTKWTIQTGIDGYRVMRVRAERRDKVRVTVSRPVWYDDEGTEHKVWVQAGPPAACEVTVTVDDRPYTSVLLYREYVQLKDNQPVAQWKTRPAHMIEKCTEADAYRKAFPQDFSGIHLDDAMPPQDPDIPVQQERQRVTADLLRQRQTVTAAVVTEDASPAEGSAPAAPAPAPPAQAAGEAPGGDERPPALIASGQLSQLRKAYERLGYAHDEEDLMSWLSAIGKLAGLAGLASMQDLTQAEAAGIIDRLEPLKNAQELMDLVETGELAAGGESGE